MHFEPLEATFCHYATRDYPQPLAPGAPTSERTLSRAAFLEFCADVELGRHADLSWFAPPPAAASLGSASHRAAGEAALFQVRAEP